MAILHFGEKRRARKKEREERERDEGEGRRKGALRRKRESRKQQIAQKEKIEKRRAKTRARKVSAKKGNGVAVAKREERGEIVVVSCSTQTLFEGKRRDERLGIILFLSYPLFSP